ncbi:MAG TPA: S49 family peptidase [Candidatus Eisenbacteria bacterium]|nr:S49 family peptidase [Candidatus Eisenbacteria bacterium]
MRLVVGASVLLAVAFAVPGSARASLVPYSAYSDLFATSPSTDDGALSALVNPAQWGTLERPELSGYWEDPSEDFGGPRRSWGLSMGSGLGFSMRREDERFPTPGQKNHVTDYQIGVGGGSKRESYSGIALGFSGHGKGAFDRSSFLTFGGIRRPSRWLSWGSTFQLALDDHDMQGNLDLGIRPLSDPRLVLFTDYALRLDQHWDDGALAGGVAIRPIPGLLAAARWERGDKMQITLGVGLYRGAFRATPRYHDGDRENTRYIARLSPPEKGFDLDGALNRGRRTMGLDLKGRMVYQSYRYFDTGSLPLRDMTQRLQFAIEDPTVGGVAVRLSGFEGNLSMAWELREKLLQVKRAQKRVTVVCDNLDGRTLYIASAADRIVMDPRGYLLYPGISASRTYLHDLLGKLGIGFDEWRYYKYKSALETFSRDRMSDADREQYEALVKANYDEIARGVTSSGRMTRAEFDRVVNEEPFVPASRLLVLKWVDALGRWEELEKDSRQVAGLRGQKPMSYAALREWRWQPRDEWGPDPEIALVYLVGECAMDTGIRARSTSAAMARLRKDRNVRAVVLRVDSPGGDPLASDLVAEQTRKLREAKKPTLVTQGRVAGSGGYWISMDGDPVVTSPLSLTGSIGVIGGWAWNEGFGKKTGLTSDHVQEGKSADLLGGLRIPFLGATLPERNLTSDERRLIRGAFDDLYTDFTTKVASARGIPHAQVLDLAEGRVYDGNAAVKLRLADRTGTMDDTIEEAKRKAGIKPKARVRIVDYPKQKLFKLPSFLREGIVIATWDADDPGQMSAERPVRNFPLEGRVLQSILDQPGRPLVTMSGAQLPDEAEPVR